MFCSILTSGSHSDTVEILLTHMTDFLSESKIFHEFCKGIDPGTMRMQLSLKKKEKNFSKLYDSRDALKNPHIFEVYSKEACKVLNV